MQRARIRELMDDPAIDPQRHRQALAGLARINRWSRGDSGLWSVLSAEARAVAPAPLQVLDLATGSGDLPLRLHARARRAGLNIAFAGCDISPTALEVARHQAERASANVEFFRCDVLKEPLRSGYDVIIASLFFHHLSEPEARKLLRTMCSAAGRLVAVNDLSRSRVNLTLVTAASRLLSRSPVVHHDGPASVRAAFTRAEALALAEGVGVKDVTIVHQFPCRWLLTARPA